MDKQQEQKKVTVIVPLAVIEGIRVQARKHRQSFNGELIWALEEYLQRQERHAGTEDLQV